MTWSLQHVVAGTDFKESSSNVVREAIRLGEVFGARVSIAHIATATGDLEERMSDFVDNLDVPTSVAVDTVIRSGTRVANELGALAEELDADLLCVGPRAHGFVEKHIRGGVAEQLLTRTTIPTLATAGPSETGYRRVLVAVDGTPASGRALRIGRTLMEGPEEERELIGFHSLSGRAVGALSQSTELDDVKQAMIENKRESLDDFIRRFVGDQVKVTVDIQVGAFGHALPARVDELSPDLVCMGTAGRKGLMGMLAGNSAERMIRNLGIPILIAHP